MKKMVWILSGCLTTFSALATDSLILTGGKSAYQANASDSALKSLAPYLIPACLIIGGLVNLIFPRFGWWLKWGWQFKDPPDPSGLWLFGERLGGLLLIGIGIAVLYGFNFVKHS
jgi:hypothetical protein